MSQNRTILTIVLLGLISLATARVDTAWVKTYNGPGNGTDYAYAIAVDGTGNVYVTGKSRGSSTNDDYATIKYGADGSEKWVSRYNGPGNVIDEAWAIAVDGAGNVYVTGRSTGSGTGYDYATIKYNPEGDTLWVKRYNGSGNSIDEAWEIAVDGAGNVYVTGRSRGANDDYATIKYNSAGDTVWVRTYNGPGNGADKANAIAVDGAGNVYVTGQSRGTNDDYATIKYNSAGDTLWVRRYNGPGNGDDNATAIAVDGAGNVYVTGYSIGTGGDYATIKYNSAGDTLWVRRYNGPGNGDDWAYAIAVDGAGNVYVTGNSYGTGYDYATIKYNPAGDTVWVKRYNGPGNSADEAKAIAVDGAGNVYVTGKSAGSGTSNDYATIKYNPAGDTLWVKRYNGPGNGSDVAYAIAVDGTGNVYVTGGCTGTGTGLDYATIKYVAPVLVSDVGCTKIEAPTGIIDLGTVITPA
ncbi:MAG: SBBP repeat-containing protein, partial [Gammaproteobacteria bacterium]|nr:SBBP repeat-containing protein [Gammaproteobacteria bacterium]